MSKYIVSSDSMDQVELPGVTDILKQLDKSGALIPWALGLSEKWATQEIEKSAYDTENERVVSLNHALGHVQDAKNHYKEVQTEALDIGSAVHDLIERHIKAKIEGVAVPFVMTEELPEAVKNGFEAFLSWESENVIRWIESEVKICNHEKGYAGTLDAIAELKAIKKRPQGIYLIDFKTSKAFYPEYALQLGAYKEARQIMEGEYLFEHEYETIENGEKVKAYTNTTHNYPKIDILGAGVLRLDKETGLPKWKDYTPKINRYSAAFSKLVEFFYLFKDRRLQNNKWAQEVK